MDRKAKQDQIVTDAGTELLQFNDEGQVVVPLPRPRLRSFPVLLCLLAACGLMFWPGLQYGTRMLAIFVLLLPMGWLEGVHNREKQEFRDRMELLGYEVEPKKVVRGPLERPTREDFVMGKRFRRNLLIFLAIVAVWILEDLING